MRIEKEIFIRDYNPSAFPKTHKLVIHPGIYAAMPGDVLVCDLRGYDPGGHFADITALLCMMHGLADMVLDVFGKLIEKLEKT